MADLELKLRLSADNRGLVQVIDASGNKVAELGAESERAGRKSEQGFARARKGVESISEQLTRARQQLLAFIGLQLSGQLIGQLGRLADEYTQLNSRIGLVTSSQAQANATFDALFEIAQRTRSELSATGELFTTLARSTQNLGLSQQQLLQITETINQSFIVSGANADSARAAITQLSQGLAAGALRGEEFNAVAEQAPILMDLLGQSLNKTRGELREFAATGGITSEILTTALLQGAADVQKQFDGMQPTIAQAKQQLDNAFTRFIGESAEASGAARLVADSLSRLAKHLDTVIDLATAGAVVLGARYAVALAKARDGVIANTAAEIAHAAALARSAGAAGVAAGAMRGLAVAGRGLLAVFGGPAGLILSAASLAFIFRDELNAAFGAGKDDLESLLAPSEDVREALARISEQLQNMEPGEGLGRAAGAMRTLQQEAQRLRAELADAEAEAAQFSGGGGSFGDFIEAETERRAQAIRDRLQVITEQIRLAQQLSGEAEFEDLTLLIEGLGKAADFAAPLLERLGLATKGAGPTPEQQAAIDKLTGSIREQITQLQAQQIELTAGAKAAAAFEDALLAADLAARAEAEGVELSTEAIQALVAERRRLIEANEEATEAQRRATEAQREAERANDAAFESLRSLVEEFERSEQATRDFALENQRLAADLGGPVTTAALEYSLAIRQALELLERGDITVEQFRQRVALLREEFGRGAAAAEGGIGLDSLAGRLSRSIIDGADITDAIGRSLRSFGGERIATELETVFRAGFNKAMEALDLSDDARANLEGIGSGVAAGVGLALQGELAQGIGTAAGAILGSVIPGIGTALGAAAGGLIGSLFGGGKVPKFQVSGAATAPFRDIGPRNQDRLDTAIGEFFLGLRELDAETEDAVANALVGFASTIAGVVRETDLLGAIEDEIANTKFSSRSDGESLERLVAEVFDNVLNALDAGIAAFVRRGANLEEQVARFEAAFAISRRLVGRRGLGLTGEGFEPITDPITDPIGPPGRRGGGGIVDPGGPVPRIQAAEMRQFAAVVQGVGDAASLSNPALLQTLELLDELQIGSESLVDTFNRLVSVTNLLDQVVALTGTQIGATREEMVRFGSELVAFFGDSAEALGQQLGVIFDRFFSDEERFAARAESARERFASLLGDLGIELTDALLTEGGFRALFDELSGLLSPEDLAILIEAGVALDSMLDAEEALAEARGETADSTRAVAELADLLAGVNDEIFALTRSPLRTEFRRVAIEADQLAERAAALGASEEQLGRIRQLETLRNQELVRQGQALLQDLAAKFLGETIETETRAIDDLNQRIEDRYSREIRALEQVRALIDQLTLSQISPLTPAQRVDEARRQFEQALAGTRSGDLDALERLPEVAQQFLRELANATGGVGEFPEEFRRVLGILRQTEQAGPRSAPPDRRSPTAADVINAGAGIEQGLSDLERAQLGSQILDVLGLVAGRTDQSPAEIAERLGLPLSDLIEAVTGELPDLTGQALAGFFNDLVFGADQQLNQLADLTATANDTLTVQERIATLLKQILQASETQPDPGIDPPPNPGVTSVPAFADGGFASGIIRTGERGRELVLPNPVTEFFARVGIPVQPAVADRAVLERLERIERAIQSAPGASQIVNAVDRSGQTIAAATQQAANEHSRSIDRLAETRGTR